MYASMYIKYTIKINQETIDQGKCSDINGSLNEQLDAYPLTSGTYLCDLKVG